MKASEVASQKRPALRVVRLVPEDWSSSWDARPKAGVAVGMRMISDADESQARKDAIEMAAALENATTDERLNEYNDALMAGVVACAICDPNDIASCFRELPTPQAHVRLALTSRAIRRLFCEWDVMAADVSPSAPHATEDDVAELIDLLLDEDRQLSNRALRFASALLEEIRD